MKYITLNGGKCYERKKKLCKGLDANGIVRKWHLYMMLSDALWNKARHTNINDRLTFEDK